MKILNKYFILFLIIFSGLQSFSQSARFRQLSVDDGLSQNSVFAITQDKQGYIWIGTVDGLNKYALEALVHDGRARIVEVSRDEGKGPRKRSIYEPVS